ncbi:hypothetical protein OGAPHI_007158 [Ogataea philodendri]|uniref:Uncharacterized protein n=1 Tax=Ogataea philodendri TaxID=1378263 RepID=A0A9P8NVT8_9ASCO|nr:uncharacterized protein OGAPHI_007158 [Ogataea philodendri]KAH3660572.1 hypothetical protein OGAPHI_007158 [Ogataea philodendri]
MTSDERRERYLLSEWWKMCCCWSRCRAVSCSKILSAIVRTKVTFLRSKERSLSSSKVSKGRFNGKCVEERQNNTLALGSGGIVLNTVESLAGFKSSAGRRFGLVTPPFATVKSLENQVVGLLIIFVAQFVQELVELGIVLFRNTNTRQNLANIIAMVTIMEQGQIPIHLHGGQKLGQGTRTIWELERNDPLARNMHFTSHKVSSMTLGHLVVCEVVGLESDLFQFFQNFSGFLIFVNNGERSEDVSQTGLFRIHRNSIRELGHISGINDLV